MLGITWTIIPLIRSIWIACLFRPILWTMEPTIWKNKGTAGTSEKREQTLILLQISTNFNKFQHHSGLLTYKTIEHWNILPQTTSTTTVYWPQPLCPKDNGPRPFCPTMSRSTKRHRTTTMSYTTMKTMSLNNPTTWTDCPPVHGVRTRSCKSNQSIVCKRRDSNQSS